MGSINDFQLPVFHKALVGKDQPIFMIMKILLSVILLSLLSLETLQDGKPTPIRVTEGPMLGRPEPFHDDLGTHRPSGKVTFYGKNADKLDQSAL